MKWFETLPKSIRRFASYAMIGILDTFLDWGAFTLSYELVHLTPHVSQGVGYFVGAISSYLLNGHFTFRDGHERPWLKFIKFAAWNVFSLLISAWLIALLTRWGMNAYFAKFFVTLEVSLVNYVGYKYLVFRVKPEHGQKREGGDEA